MTKAKNRKIVVFLDYDGTLSPIVDDPDRAFMSADVSFCFTNLCITKISHFFHKLLRCMLTYDE